eukprot:CAMPEP_0172152296 /NCGR_PEP_ID=MMETSP1050-20130122/755_1 /TAXON_ID=233186 /ORGANISM="Cryptomonas curvata, Strain CCAP979/52" /LENGTH=330 /DNA_ID=CAMNT_0012820595 /DNA_START=181 /DNA_END=1173 /DNA_ORIENTATION=+
MTSVPGLSELKIYVDIDSSPVPPAAEEDKMVVFFQFVSNCLLELGGAIPSIVDNTLGDTWRQQLEDGLQNRLTAEKLSELTHQLNGRSIYIFDDPRPGFIVPRAEANASWTLPDAGFTGAAANPEIDQAELLIYLSDLGIINDAVDHIRFSGHVVGRSLKFIHELTHAMRMLRRLLESRMHLKWTMNGDGDWCVEKSQFMSLLATPPKLGTATGINNGGDFLADAGRTWEHSITNGMAFFQRNVDIFIARQSPCGQHVDYICEKLNAEKAHEVKMNPASLIQLSRDFAAEMEKESSPSKIIMYCTPSMPVVDFQYACSSSGWCMANHAQA